MTPTGSGNKTRADQVRARRQMEKAPKKPSTGQHPAPANRSTPQQRVTSRRVGKSTSSKSKSANPPNRRKVYMQLNTPGAEVRLPSIPNLSLGWRFASVVILVSMILVANALWNLSLFQVEGIELIGAQRLTAEEISTQLDILGKSIVEIIPTNLENKILFEFPDLKIAEVKVGLPAAITIAVEERIPAVIWMPKDGPSMWIDEEGFMFPARGDATLPVKVQAYSDPPSPPVLLLYEETEKEPQTTEEILLDNNPDVDPAFIFAVLSLRDVVPDDSVLIFDQQYGLGWDDPRGWQVYFGINTQNIDLKLAQYDVIVEKLQNQNIHPVLISLEFLHAPFYRMEQ
ncbi:MAG: hypothetical protein ABIG43_07195 [Chloroflexota bacterium]